jgi:hypothetical protein
MKTIAHKLHPLCRLYDYVAADVLVCRAEPQARLGFFGGFASESMRVAQGLGPASRLDFNCALAAELRTAAAEAACFRSYSGTPEGVP